MRISDWSSDVCSSDLVYIERRMTPLNLYLMRCSDQALDVAIQRYGDAIRELAAANIFPGDMLFKNFGVTRLGRVVRSEEHTSELQSLMRISYAVFCLNKTTKHTHHNSSN